MKNIFLGIAVALFFNSAYAQLEIDNEEVYLLSQKNTAYEKTEVPAHYVNIGLKYHINSNAVTNDFFKGLLFGGFIEDELKDQVSGRLKNENRAGYDFNTGITYAHPLKEDLNLIVGLNQRQQFNVKHSGDLFELIFRGNKQFVGQKAALSPLNLNFFDYQSLFLGLEKTVRAKLKLGGGISIIRGGSYNTIQIDRGALYTEPSGSYLEFDMDFKWAFHERENFFASNGLGAALNLNAAILSDKGQLNFEVRDLGVIKWDGLNVYEGSGVYRYDGAEVGDIFNFDDTTFTRVNADTIAADLGIVRKEQDLTYTLPATIHLNYVRHLSEKVSMVAGVKYMATAAYIPRVYVKGIYYFNEKFMVAPTLAYGGFGRLDFELGLAKNFNNSFLISGNLFYLEYLLLPKKSAGHGFNIGLTKLF